MKQSDKTPFPVKKKGLKMGKKDFDRIKLNNLPIIPCCGSFLKRAEALGLRQGE